MRLLPLPVRPATRRGLKCLCFVVLALLLTGVACLPPAHSAHASASSAARVRIGVNADGITAVAPADLAGAGIDLNSVDPNTFALSSLGLPVAIYVTGEDDGRFDGGDRIYFFGEKFRGPEMDQKYTDERVYWLDMGGAAGPRMGSVDAAAKFDRTPPADFATTLRAEESMRWFTRHTLSIDSEDTWFWFRLQPSSSSASVTTGYTETLPYIVPHPAYAPATLRVEEVSDRTHNWNVNPDHMTRASLNGTEILRAGWDGPYARTVLSASVPPGLLQDGPNKLDVGAWTAPGTTADDVYVNYWEVDYRQQFQAWQDRLDFHAEAGGTQEYTVSGFSGPDVWIWDITSTGATKRLLPGPAGWQGRFRTDTTAGNHYWLQTPSTFQSPASVRLRPPTGLRNPPGGADAVIVTSAELRPQAERLAEWHRAQGRRALVVDIQDAYDEFNEGIYHPKAVQAMMKWASANWTAPAPAYLTLFGDGHWNFKNYNPAVYPGGPNPIPPYLAWEDPWQGEVPVDARYGDIDGDRLPEIAVGRIAVNTLDEAKTVVDKILAYDSGLRLADWQRRAVFVADTPDPNAGDFPAVSDEIVAGYTPADLTPVRVYLPGATRNDLLAQLNSGAFMVQYTGHGAPQLWSQSAVFTTADIPTLTNGSRLPVVLTFNCLDGYFAHAQPASTSIAETMQRKAGGGSIAAISPSGLGTTDDQQAFRKVLLTVMFKENVRELGRALTIAKRRYSEVHGVDYITQTTMLFGDPAMRLPGAAPRLYLPILRR